MQYYIKKWENFFNFDGRATRAEYWWPMLIEMVAGFIVGLLIGTEIGEFLGIITVIYSLAALIPTWSLAVRRFHDVGKPGGLFFKLAFTGFGLLVGGYGILFFSLLNFSMGGMIFGGVLALASIVPSIMTIVILASKSEPRANQYGQPEFVESPPMEYAAYAPTALAADDSLVFCRICGTKAEGAENFCGDCGSKLPQTVHTSHSPAVFPATADNPIVCKICGTRYTGSEVFCGNCGNEI
ncbi:MAG: DUF805 domain-containing protein [Defluviitaleaceae bacterium]|nr:DUF805 domain-containing protein [Defluviitaleaceae bacterium]